MRSLIRCIVCLAALSGLAAAHPTFNKSAAIPSSARILFIGTPDLQKNDPQRKVCVLAPSGDVSRVSSGRTLDKRVLKYLREMIAVSRRLRRRDMKWYYQAGWEFAAARIYGALPPRKEDMLGSYYQASNPAVPESFRPRSSQQPLRRIVKLNEHPHGFTTLKWEMLECGHELLAPVGYGVPAKRRRCIYCAFAAAEKAVAKKLPAAVPIAKSKAVGA